MARLGIQLAVSRLSVNDRPSRIIGRIAELRRRNARFVIDSAAISHDSTSVMPPASKVAKERVAWATDNWIIKLPASGIFMRKLSMVIGPGSVRDQRNSRIATQITSGPNQIML